MTVNVQYLLNPGNFAANQLLDDVPLRVALFLLKPGSMFYWKARRVEADSHTLPGGRTVGAISVVAYLLGLPA
jgi:hypothetical protein